MRRITRFWKLIGYGIASLWDSYIEGCYRREGIPPEDIAGLRGRVAGKERI
jgi:hypothetical protein